MLCDVEIGLIIFNKKGGLHEYSSNDMSKLLFKYTETETPVESRNNESVIFKIP